MKSDDEILEAGGTQEYIVDLILTVLGIVDRKSGNRPGQIEVVKQIIRNEKLKLLAEVRERVVGENQHSEHKEWNCPCGVTHSFTEEWHATNRLRDEQRTALDKLEAEL